MGIWKNAKWLNFEQRFINISEPGEILTARLYDDVVASNLKQHYDNWRLCFKLMFSIIVAAIILLVLCFQFHCVSIWLVLIIIMTFVPIQCIASQNAIQYRCLLEPQLPALLVNTPRILLGEENNRGAG